MLLDINITIREDEYLGGVSTVLLKQNAVEIATEYVQEYVKKNIKLDIYNPALDEQRDLTTEQREKLDSLKFKGKISYEFKVDLSKLKSTKFKVS